MKRSSPLAFLLALVTLSSLASGQFGPQQVINTQVGARSVYAADLDGDGDADVLSASWDNVSWHENLGCGLFGTQQVVTTQVHSARSVYAADLDGDGDQDVLSASENDDRIAWYENTNGLGLFGSQQVLNAQASGAICVYATDLDGDGDRDVLSASFGDDTIAWYENTDGLGTFGPQQNVTTSADRAMTVFAADLDGDGDQDVLSASEDDDKVAWYENLGGGAFGAQQVITTLADRALSVYATDLDGDGDADVLSASVNDDKIAWYENVGAGSGVGGGSFGPQQVITTAANAATWVYAADLDGDGDQDVISASHQDHKIAWYENFGGAFGSQQVITTQADGAHSVYATDLDGDGDADVLSASEVDGKIAWYESLLVVPPGFGYCFGDPGVGTPCPCGDNDGSVPGSGCDNGVFASGAKLVGSGVASILNDTLVLTTTHLEPNNTGLYFQANNLVAGGNGSPFGDGLRCTGGSLIRIQIRFADAAGTSSTTIPISVKGGVAAGDTKRYQCWYRTQVNPPCGLHVNDFNLSNGYEITWLP